MYRVQGPARLIFRHVSTSSYPSISSLYPFPQHPHPTPHQIFHLSSTATQQDIKARYFDLVKIYHPDSPHSRQVPSSVRHARFQSITYAYDVLRGKASRQHLGDTWNDSVYAELERRRRYRPSTHGGTRASSGSNRGWGAGEFAFSWDDYTDNARSRSKTLDGANDQWKDKVILCAAVLAVGAAIFPSIMYISPQQTDNRHRSAASNLAEARREAREFGMERRAEIRKRVKAQREKDEKEAELGRSGRPDTELDGS
ncbi:hypothetical protein BDW22DRAFT_1380502 [Trametopsis cervina]|nr:hypothetical protein BDW22DRAFT_1380502 [Trametopsis cervina]